LKGDKEMKKYKTWEVIKAMTENKDLRFKYNTGYETGEIAVVRGDIRVVKCDGKPIDTHFELHTGFIGTKWELIQQPIPFMEAVKAYSEGKPVDCEICGKVWHYNPNSIPKDSSLGYHLVVTNKCGTSPSITTEEILRGKWTIAEDSNE
jgi:hypothetical protein